MAWTGKEAAGDPSVKKTLEEACFNVKEWFERLPLKRGASPLRHAPAYEQWYFDEITHGDYDEFWQNSECNIEEDIDRYADVPIYLLSSWYGHHTWAKVIKYLEFTKRHRQPVKLLVGCWVHHGLEWMQSTWAGDVDFGLESALGNPNDLALRWFDHWLKGMRTGIMEEPPIKVFVMGGGDGRKNEEGRMNHGGRWRYENEWPLARIRFANYYLHADGSLSPEPPRADDPPSSFSYNPSDPVPTLGGNFQDPGVPGLLESGAFDQRGREALFSCKDRLPLAERSDVLAFQTAPLAQDVEVTGPLTVRLWVSSSAVDTDFTAKLIDVYPPNQDYPDGYAMNLADSILRMRYRNSRERLEMMIPGEIYEIVIEPQPTSNLFKAGHRIRLDISSSNFPQFDVNPNTGGPLGMERRVVIAHNTVYHDAARPSHIVLPIVRE